MWKFYPKNVCYNIARLQFNNNSLTMKCAPVIRYQSTQEIKVKSLASKYRTGKQDHPEFIKWLLLVIPVASFGLGCWQVQRRRWKLKLIDMIQSQGEVEPLSLPLDLDELPSLEYRPIRVQGHFLHEKETLIGPRALIEHGPNTDRPGMVSDPKKNQGWLVVTPFKLSDRKFVVGKCGNVLPLLEKQVCNPGVMSAYVRYVRVYTYFIESETILINRGWIPPKMRSSLERGASYVTQEVELVGVVRLMEKRPPFVPKNNPQKSQWFYRDLDEMSSFLDCAPVWLDAKGIPEPPAGWPIPNQTRVSIRNEHMSYLITWYSLSFLTSIMWYRVFFKRMPML